MNNSHQQLNGLLIVGLVLSVVTAATFTARADAGSKKSGPSTHANSDAIEVPRSVFTIPAKASDGRDPFFPLSRRMVVEAKPNNGDTPKSAPVSLTLKGIARTPDKKRFAMINDKTFSAGEEREVMINNSRVRVHCVEIKEDSVVIEVNGERKELRMRPGL